MDILAPLDFRVAEQVIEVPKIVCPPRAARTVLRAPQTADQLVEVPTIISYSSLLQRISEQHVDIPVPFGSGGRNADLQGFLRGQSSTAPYSSLERISEQIMEQIADIPVACGDPHGFRPGQSSSSVAHSPAAWLNTEDEPFQRGFRTFSPEEKSATDTRHMGARVPRHVSSSTSSANGPRTCVDDDTGDTWTMLTDPALGSWWYSLRSHRSQWHPLSWLLLVLVDVPVNMHYKFQQSMFMTTGVFQFINSMLDPSCLQILVRTVHTVQQTVDPHRYSSWVGCQRLLMCNERCPGWSAQKTVEFRSCSACGRCPVSGQGCCARRCSDCVRAMLGSTMDTYSASSTVAFGSICTIFYMKG